MDAQVDGRTFSRGDDLVFDLLAGLGHHFLDAGRVDASVGTSLWSESRAISRRTGSKQERMMASGVSSSDDLYAGSQLQGADIAAFATDDAALDVVRFDVEGRDAFSMASSVAVRWMVWMTIFLASFWP